MAITRLNVLGTAYQFGTGYENEAGEKNVIVVSNRLPVVVEEKAGEHQFHPAVGGLATGMKPFFKEYGASWIGWPGLYPQGEEERKGLEKRLEKELRYSPVYLTEEELDKYYYGFSNKTIWPLFHYFPQYTVYDGDEWEAYKSVNRRFRDKILEATEGDKTIWIHDYHLMLLPKMIREERPDAEIGFFLHIPFPSVEVFRLFPWRNELLDGLLGADQIGFHTHDYASHFLRSVQRLRGHRNELGKIILDKRTVSVDAFPMAIAVNDFEEKLAEPDTGKERNVIKNKTGEGKIIFSIDRLDYTKGIPERLEGYERFLLDHPEWHGRVTFILVSVPSRTNIDRYQKLRERVNRLVGRINGKYSKPGWIPIIYMNRKIPFRTLVALYNLADVGLITPLRDGMNLIAKEYVVTTGDGGVLVLSEMAGAASDLGEALIVNPNDKEEIADSIQRALTMPRDERRQRMRAMKDRITDYDVFQWGKDFLHGLKDANNGSNSWNKHQLSRRGKEIIIDNFATSRSRLIFLDYEGSVADSDQGKLEPDNRIKDIINRLRKDKRNTLVLFSGLDRDTLQKWFGDLGVEMVSDHGAWIYKPDIGKWDIVQKMPVDWKDTLRPILNSFVRKVPGSKLEEKEFSLSWQYGGVKEETAGPKAKELVGLLQSLASNLDLHVFEIGGKIEVRNMSVNKGTAARKWINGKKWDFVMAVGDDPTDEHTFRVLPEHAVSIKVGDGPSLARYHVKKPEQVLDLLRPLAGIK